MCFTKRSHVWHREMIKMIREDYRCRDIQHIPCHHDRLCSLVSASDDGLCFPDQPLQRLLLALPLQLCSHHLQTLPVVVVHPVTLRDRGHQSCVHDTQKNVFVIFLKFRWMIQKVCCRDRASHLFLSEQVCVDHLDLDGDQSEWLKRQTPSVSVVVLCMRTSYILMRTITEVLKHI